MAVAVSRPASLSFRLLNVFAIPGEPFSGNPLAVFEDAAGLDDATMQALARQFNLSETTFVTSGVAGVDACVRIFTPGYEMPFAGHPTLGTAGIVGAHLGRSEVVLRVPAGDIPVCRAPDRAGAQAPSERVEGTWVLTAHPATVTAGAAARAVLATVIGLTEADVVDRGWWVDAGVDQFLIEVRSVDAVRRVVADPRAAAEHVLSPRGESMALVWSWTGTNTIEARFFFSQDGVMLEDPATGSAAANLASLLASRGFRGSVTVSQGAAVNRPSRLHLEVSEEGKVRVGGLVREVGRGRYDL